MDGFEFFLFFFVLNLFSQKTATPLFLDWFDVFLFFIYFSCFRLLDSYSAVFGLI